MAKRHDMKQIEKQVKETVAGAKKALAKAEIKDPDKKKRAQMIKALEAAAKLDEL